LSLIIVFFSLIPHFVLSIDNSFLPIPSEPIVLLDIAEDSWRDQDFEFYIWDKLDKILIFDTADYAVQDKFFKKLAFFTEKQGYIGKIHSESTLADKHGYNAHNYSSSDLSAFFNMGINGNLNFYEQLLLEILIANGLFVKRDQSLYPVAGGVISISYQSDSILRKHLLTHELLHGIFYTLPAYQKGVSRIWKSLSAKEQEIWTLFLSSNGYDTNNPNVRINEFHAYLLQQSVDSINDLLFSRVLSNIKVVYPQKKKFVNAFSLQCRHCFEIWASRVGALLTSTGREAGFDYLDYLIQIRPY